MTMTDSQTVAPPRLRWYQFSLRTLLLMVLVCAIPCSWFATRMQQVKKQREAIKVFRQFPGRIYYDYELSKQQTNPPGPLWLRNLLGNDFFAHIEFVCLGCNEEFTDAEMADVESLPRLKFLLLDDAAITDAGLKHLSVLTQLQELHLSSNKITDNGLDCLKGLSKLQTLYLGSTNITDSGIEYLKCLPQLQKLYLIDTKVTDEGVKKLKEALPNCQIDK